MYSIEVLEIIDSLFSKFLGSFVLLAQLIVFTATFSFLTADNYSALKQIFNWPISAVSVWLFIIVLILSFVPNKKGESQRCVCCCKYATKDYEVGSIESAFEK